MRSIGLVVNPIAGMGGRVGLKGTDGVLDEARARGAEPRANERAVAALAVLASRAPDVQTSTYAGSMGADAAREAGLDPDVIGSATGEETTADDTRAAVRAFLDRGVDLVVFVGGDGTAVDVAEALSDAAEETAGTADAPEEKEENMPEENEEENAPDETPILGVPAGVKVYSSVFAVSPEAAGRIAAAYATGETDRVEGREVNDIDEAAYREGEVRATLRAVATVPVAADLQSGKQVHGGTVDTLAEGFADTVESGVTYVLGPGGTVGAIKSALGFEGSPLGVDVWRDGEVLLRDASEREILDVLGEENRIVVSPIGGQGFVFGRGNDQLSPDVIRRCLIEVVATREKLADLGVLRVDTGDPALDDELRGWRKVRVGRYQQQLLEVV